ncbi:hypothetical protein CPB84DRAFT_1850825 [Gymnopilus junonius]|uniref:Uncharacterized protein n=1 Tax=Gymnopilus junonius TaxID=109634 RepID=A0A9P5NGG6_GYMJU|nr:hypothetical protein CPB84DRAFT_1850825 [Gymnopilus junonius]
MVVAHLRYDADEWYRLVRESRERGYNQQALYCYHQGYSLDSTSVDALWHCAYLAKEMSDLRTTRNAFLAILKRFLFDLRKPYTVFVKLCELPTCASLLQDALNLYMKKTYLPGQQAARTGVSAANAKDLCEDVRVHDGEDCPLRTNANKGGGGVVPPGHYILDLKTRHRLVVARIKVGDVEEGKLHTNAVLAEEVLDHSVLFAETADAYFERGIYPEAKPICELLGCDPATSGTYIFLQTIACMRSVDNLQAANAYERVRHPIYDFIDLRRRGKGGSKSQVRERLNSTTIRFPVRRK